MYNYAFTENKNRSKLLYDKLVVFLITFLTPFFFNLFYGLLLKDIFFNNFQKVFISVNIYRLQFSY